MDVVIVARASIAAASWPELVADFRGIMARAGLAAPVEAMAGTPAAPGQEPPRGAGRDRRRGLSFSSSSSEEDTSRRTTKDGEDPERGHAV